MTDTRVTLPRGPALEDLSADLVPVWFPHPTMGCTCMEGRIIGPRADRVRHFLPGVHDCRYIAERNARLESRS